MNRLFLLHIPSSLLPELFIRSLGTIHYSFPNFSMPMFSLNLFHPLPVLALKSQASIIASLFGVLSMMISMAS